MLNQHEATAHIEANAEAGEQWAIDALRSLNAGFVEEAITLIESAAVAYAQDGNARRATYLADILAGLITGLDKRRSADDLRVVWEQLSAIACELYVCGHEDASAHVDSLCDRIDVKRMAVRPAYTYCM